MTTLVLNVLYQICLYCPLPKLKFPCQLNQLILPFRSIYVDFVSKLNRARRHTPKLYILSKTKNVDKSHVAKRLRQSTAIVNIGGKKLHSNVVNTYSNTDFQGSRPPREVYIGRDLLITFVGSTRHLLQ